MDSLTRLGRPADGACELIKSPKYTRKIITFYFNVVFLQHIYASPAALLRLTPPVGGG
jgi:hypothetical protein